MREWTIRRKARRPARLGVEELERRDTPAVIDLNALGTGGATLRGYDDDGLAGTSVSGAGDVNGDGFDDVIVGAPQAGVGGEAYLIFGGPGFGGTTLPLNNHGPGGLTLRGGPFQSAGTSVAGAGDVDGDGFDDVIVGDPNAFSANFGAAYIVYGRSAFGGTILNLGNLGNDGLMIFGSGRVGHSVSGAGDVNRDGYADVIVGAPGLISTGGSGDAYVILGGRRPGASIDIHAMGTQGVTLRGFQYPGLSYFGSGTGYSVDGAGDVNRDGFDDVIVGAPYSNGGVPEDPEHEFWHERGESYIVFGGESLGGTVVDLDALGTGGFTLRGFRDGALAGFSVAGVGDVNRNGHDDVMVGAPGTTSLGHGYGGEAYVFGGSSGLGGTTTDLNNMGGRGVAFFNGEGDALVGWSVAGAGDVNRDGYADMLVGAPGRDLGGTDRGGAYVVNGRLLWSSTFNLNSLTTDGLILRGFQNGAQAGWSVAGAGNFNGLGGDDLIVGAPLTDAKGTDRGEAYLVFAPRRSGESSVTGARGGGISGPLVQGSLAAEPPLARCAIAFDLPFRGWVFVGEDKPVEPLGAIDPAVRWADTLGEELFLVDALSHDR